MFKSEKLQNLKSSHKTDRRNENWRGNQREIEAKQEREKRT
jgi:hypothetical protein